MRIIFWLIVGAVLGYGCSRCNAGCSDLAHIQIQGPAPSDAGAHIHTPPSPVL